MEYSNKNMFNFKLLGLLFYGITFSWEGEKVAMGGDLGQGNQPLGSLLDSTEDQGEPSTTRPNCFRPGL